MYFNIKDIVMTADNPAKVKEYIQETLQKFKEDEISKDELIDALEEMMEHDIFSSDWVMVRTKKELPVETGSSATAVMDF